MDLVVGGSERLTGWLADGTPVDFQPFVISGGTARIVLHEVTETPGDSFPTDGVIDINDLNRVRNNFGTGQMGGEPITGDTFPYDGIVDVNDLNRIRNRFGTSRPNARPPGAVPEPTAITLMILGTAGLMYRSAARRRRK